MDRTGHHADVALCRVATPDSATDILAFKLILSRDFN